MADDDFGGLGKYLDTRLPFCARMTSKSVYPLIILISKFVAAYSFAVGCAMGLASLVGAKKSMIAVNTLLLSIAIVLSSSFDFNAGQRIIVSRHGLQLGVKMVPMHGWHIQPEVLPQALLEWPKALRLLRLVRVTQTDYFLGSGLVMWIMVYSVGYSIAKALTRILVSILVLILL